MALIPIRTETELEPSWQTNPQRDSSLVSADQVAAFLPELLIAADRIAANMTSGLHGRRRVGSGENFWQFRQFDSGDNAARIDWRRSARSDSFFIREHEWDTPQTVWLWCDTSLSMRVKSSLVSHTKLERGLLVLFAVARLLATAGEKIGLLGLTNAISGRSTPSTLAEHLTQHLQQSDQGTAFPVVTRVARHSDVILLSDFLSEEEQLDAQIRLLEATGARVHVLQILDPLEEQFPFAGRIEFQDPETGQRLVAGRAEDWQVDYRVLVKNLQQTLRDKSRARDWTYQLHLTDKPAATAVLTMHLALSNALMTSGGN